MASSSGADDVLPGVAETLAGSHIFITGATGFLGKAVVEKLLRSVPDLGGIYILARGKRDLTAQDRVTKLLSEKLFERCREEQPDCVSKVTVVTGDIEEPGLGLSESDLEIVTDNANVVIHSAATIRFTEHIKKTLRSNLQGTQHVVELARKLKTLKAFIHVSTAFVNCHQEETNECVYKPEVPPQKLMDMLEWMDEDLSRDLTPKLLYGRPNTYILTKGLTEQWLVENASDLPIAMFRPSIIAATMNEPFEGWCESLNGPIGLILSVGKGLLRTTLMDPNIGVDIIPLDICTNMLISILWRAMVQRPERLLIYHGCTSGVNKTNYKSLIPVVFDGLRETPYDVIFARPWARLHVSPHMYYIERVFFHLIPAYAYDTVMRLMGEKPRLVRIYKAIHANTEQYAYFQMNEFKWQMDNYYALLEMMSPEDRETFNFDMASINWQKYWRDSVIGTKKFIMKEDMSKESVEKARKQYSTMRLRRLTWNFCLALAASRFLSRFKWIRSWWVNMFAIIQLSLQTFPILARIFLF